MKLPAETEINPTKPPTPRSAIQFVTSVPAETSLLIGSNGGGARSFSWFPRVGTECIQKTILLPLRHRMALWSCVEIN
jgi:hypothetical protein